MHEGRIQNQSYDGNRPREIPKGVGSICDPVKADQSQSELSPPGFLENRAKIFILGNGEPQRNPAKNHGPAGKRRVRSGN